MTLSRGFMRDLLVCQFAAGLIKTSMMSEKQDGLITLLAGHKYTPLIKDASSAIEERLTAVFKENITRENSSWFRSKLNSKISPLLHKLDNEKVELLSFALYLLYVNFSDNREKVLSDKFKQFIDPQQYFYVLDMVDTVRGTENNISDDMYDMAIYCIKELKGK